MKRVKFLRTELYESEGRNLGPTYKEGSTHDFEDHLADRWLRRGAAVEVKTREPLPEDGETLDPLDHDHDGVKGGAIDPSPLSAEEEFSLSDEGEADEFDAMSDDDLRDHLTERDGKAPHHNAKRETLLAKARGE
jgi:hypothetical protein